MTHLLPRISTKDEDGKMINHSWEDMEREYHSKKADKHFHRARQVDSILFDRGFGLDDRRSVAGSLHQIHLDELENTPALGGLTEREMMEDLHSHHQDVLDGMGDKDEKKQESEIGSVTAHPHPLPEFKLSKSGLKDQLAAKAQRAEDLVNKARQKQYGEDELDDLL